MEVNLVTPTEVVMSFEIANSHFKFAKVVGMYSFKEGNLTYDVYPIMGLTPPRIILTQPIARVSMKMSLSKSMLTMYELEKSTQFGFDSELGYHVQLNGETYVWTIDDGDVKFIRTKDDSDEAALLFSLDMDKCTSDEIPAIFYSTDNKSKLTKNIKYKVVS